MRICWKPTPDLKYTMFRLSTASRIRESGSPAPVADPIEVSGVGPYIAAGREAHYAPLRNG